ncbi:MAG TPA: cytochrome c maturation protein CcmE [Dehalococcoidia bacterium]|nr:cytochrome c maturation protein CcmE [Dehalococcoidia bacterium]
MVEWSADRPLSQPAARRRTVPAKFLVVGLVVALAIGYLIFTAIGQASVYYLTVSELRAQGAVGGRPVRVSGDVVAGSIARDGTSLRFDISDGGGTLPVVYQGIVPDIFADNVQVVVEGRTQADGAFQANTLLAKCPSKFEAATRDLGL